MTASTFLKNRPRQRNGSAIFRSSRPFYMNETPAEYLRFVGEAKGLKGKELHSQIDSVIGRTGLDHVRNRRISALSKGYKQRVGIAQAFWGTRK